jgi:uroporphyrinogen decarboxylase
VLASINHKEPDKVPIDIGSTLQTGISAIAYYNLKKYLGIKEGNVRIYDVIQQLAQVEDWFIERYGIDALDIGSEYLTDDKDWYDVEMHGIKAQFPVFFQPRHNPDNSFELILSDGTIISRMSKDSLVMDQTYYPWVEGYPENITFQSYIEALNKNMWTKCVTPPLSNMGEKRFWRTLREKSIQLREKTKKIIVLNLGASIFQAPHVLRRMDKFLMDTVRNPEKVDKIVNLQIEFYINAVKVLCKYLGDVIDIITFGDDLGENNGPMISLKTYRKFFKRGHQEVCDYIKKHSSMKIFFHSCGSIVKLLPDLIECGIDILNPVQISARDMDPKYLKENFGDDITFWGGGADTRHILNRKSPEEVKKHVKELLEIFAPGGGYIWNTVHNILPDVPPENIVAALEAVEEYNIGK